MPRPVQPRLKDDEKGTLSPEARRLSLILDEVREINAKLTPRKPVAWTVYVTKEPRKNNP